METVTPVSISYHVNMRVTTRHATEFVDITERIEQFVAHAGLGLGLINIQTLHTTTAIVVNEHEPLLLGDFEALLESTAPRRRHYRHDDTAARTVNLTDAERPNGHAHCRALMLPATATLNVVHGALILGRWQRIFFVELDGPRDREISVLVFGEGGR